VQKYLYSGYFLAGCIVAFITHQIVVRIWGEGRQFALGSSRIGVDTIATVVGVVMAVLAVILAWRNNRIRTLSQETVDELAKVTWPTRQETYGATVVVLVTSIVSAVMIFMLDRFWSWLTDLIYR
jgi:preprotein translocase subunit SecE